MMPKQLRPGQPRGQRPGYVHRTFVGMNDPDIIGLEKAAEAPLIGQGAHPRTQAFEWRNAR